MGRMTHSDPLQNDSHPWGRRGEIGFGRALIDTTVAVITSPAETYKKIDPDSPMGGAILYGVLMGTAGNLGALVWQVLMQLAGLSAGAEPLEILVPVAIVWVGVLLFVPVGVLIGMFATAGILHLVLLVPGWSEKPFGATVKVVSFAQVASLAALLPFCGPLVGAVWGVVLAVIGIRELHAQSTGRAVTVVVAPLLILFTCALCGLAATFLLAFGAAL